MLLMKQTARIISTYAADVSGVCSALYELGGMTVMHDASGCNSTYNTHDEPRWYDMDSMVYISALSEMEAVMGDDRKLVDDIVSVAKGPARRIHRRGGHPHPHGHHGTDFEAVAAMIEKESGIPTMGLPTDRHALLSERGLHGLCRAGPPLLVPGGGRKDRVAKRQHSGADPS